MIKKSLSLRARTESCWDVENNGTLIQRPGRGASRRRASDLAAARPSRWGSRTPSWSSGAKRRHFRAEYKLRILREAEACTRPGEIGALLRREGLYTSHLVAWRKQRDVGALGAWSARAAASRRTCATPRTPRCGGAQERAEAELEKARRVIEIQGNVSALLEQMLGTEGASRRGAPGDDRETVEELTPIIGTRPACRALGASPATVYRRRRPPAPRPAAAAGRPRGRSLRAEREAVLAELHSERFVDRSPAQVWATLLDEGTYLASERTMYRLLAAEHGRVRERREQRRAPRLRAPELLAEPPQRGLLLGHHQAARAGEVDLLLPLRDPRRLQPLRRRLDRPAPRERPRRQRR